MHELYSDLIVVENQTIIDLDLRNGTNSEYDLGDDSKVTLTAHHNVMHIGAVRDTRPQVSLCVSASRCHIGHIAEHVLAVTVSVLLHATSAS